MLRYCRRNTANVLTVNLREESATPLLTYCNWSYSLEYHIDLATLKNILRSFNEEYIPYYLRIFNETPSQVLEQYEISKNSLEGIYQNLLYNSMQVKNNYWSIER